MVKLTQGTASRTPKARIAPMASIPLPVPVVADTSVLLLSALKGVPIRRGLGSRGRTANGLGLVGVDPDAGIIRIRVSDLETMLRRIP